MLSLRLFLLFIPLTLTKATFTTDFNNFLTATYGADVQEALERRDLNNSGSFGGRTLAGDKLRKQPVIFVHGLTMNAFGFEDIRKQFLKRRFTNAELYATTYGGGDTSNLLDTPMKCEYVKQVRRLIIAVHNYTGSLVNVVSYSMGVPISRKAILGGKCVESGEDLGAPLTKLVHTFVGIAGANYGADLCLLHLLQFSDTCDKTTGLDCSSKFLSDINNHKSKYEGKYIFSIFSPDDEVVGYKVCGSKIASFIPNQNKGFKIRGNHDDMLYSTVGLQYLLVLTHKGI